MAWTPERIAELQQLWDKGLSTAEIGRRLGISKNAVVGKAHRLSLAPRPSPIARTAAAAPRRVVELKGNVCCWPIGDPGRPDFRFCGKRAAHAKPYCVEHVSLAYVRRPDKSKVSAA